MSKSSLGVVLTSLLVISGTAFADSFTFFSPGTVTWNGVYVNPYQANNNTHPDNNPLTVYCDDWNTDFSGTPTWNAQVYTLTAANASHFKYGATTLNYNVTLVGTNLTYALDPNPTAFDRYLEAAYLDQEWELENASGDALSVKQDKQKKLAAAGWTLFVDTAHVSGLVGAINSSGYATDVFNYLQGAEAAVAAGYTAPGWEVIVPVGLNSNNGEMQEFLFHAPEPSAVILLGTVAGFLGLAKLRRKRQA